MQVVDSELAALSPLAIEREDLSGIFGGRYEHAAPERDPVAGSPSQQRRSAAVFRLSRRAALAEQLVAQVFGAESSVARVLQRRIEAMRTASRADRAECAERLHALVTWLAATTESIELEDAPAAQLHADLSAIATELEMIVAA